VGRQPGTLPLTSPAPLSPFHHEAVLYATEEELLAATVPFLRDAVRAGEPALVVLRQDSLELVADALGDDAGAVAFADMDDVGANPGRIIPAWQEFVTANAGRALRGIGEPINPHRHGAELEECHRHESLLNLAFADAEDFWLLCPYDTSALAPGVVATARRTHPYVANGTGMCAHDAFHGHVGHDVLSLPLSSVPADAVTHAFAGDDLSDVRRVAGAFAERAGFAPDHVADFVLGVHEVAANSVRHGPGHGVLSLWAQPDRLIAQVDDTGRFVDPLVGRVEPDLGARSGRGLWLTNSLFDLVQIRSFASGAVVRMHFVIR